MYEAKKIILTAVLTGRLHFKAQIASFPLDKNVKMGYTE
jgi:hypothetical protein